MSQSHFYTRPLSGREMPVPASPVHHTITWYEVCWAGIGIVGCGVLYLLFLFLTLPNIDDPRSLIASQSTLIVDREGTELYRLFNEEDRTYIAGTDISQQTKNAIVAIEDERFFDRGCIDIRAIARAILANVFRGFKSQGASTITQQLARTALLTRQKRITRKVRELMLACALEKKFSKSELLDLYLNWIPFGRNAYGIEQASLTYFGVHARELTIAQSVILAALPQRPSYFSPYGEHVRTELTPNAYTAISRGEIVSSSDLNDTSIVIGLIGNTFSIGGSSVYLGGRTDQVLFNMKKLGFITEEQRLHALEELDNMTFQPLRENIRAPHFVLWIREQVTQILGAVSGEGMLEQGGLTIETTLSWPLQELAERIVDRHAPDILKIYGAHNIALVAIHPITKEILAYVGNTNFHDKEHGGKVDMARSPRQPGSSFKPFVYARAFEEGYGPSTVLYDVPTKIGDDEPQNFDKKFLGLLTIRKALATSRNVPATKAFFLAGGEEKILRLATRMGVPSPQLYRDATKMEHPAFDYGWPLALGAAEVPLLEMIHGYSTFASQGIFRPIQAIRRITDKHGNILFDAQTTNKISTDSGGSLPGEQVLDPRIAYQITSILSDEQARPAGYWRTQLSIPGFETAAKTGTSNKCLERENAEGAAIGPDPSAASSGPSGRSREEILEKKNQDEGNCILLKPTNGLVLGFTPNLAAGVWVGNADATSMYERGDGLNSGSPVWRDFMIQAHKILSSQSTAPLPTGFTKPDGILQMQISTLSGELPSICTPITSRQPELFREEFSPSRADPACTHLRIDKVTNLLASEECPSEATEERDVLVVYSVLPERFPEWKEGIRTWAEEQTRLWYATSDHSGSILPLPVAPNKTCTLSLTPGRLDQPSVRILTPLNGGSVTFPSFRPHIDFSLSRQSITYRIDGKVVATVVGTGSRADPVIDIPRSMSKNGEHTLDVELTDRYFNKVNDSVRFHFEEDTVPPHISFLIPRGDITLAKGAELHLQAEASDTAGGIKYVQFYLGNILLSTKPKTPYELFYNIQESPGIFPLRAVAQDLAGNKGEARLNLTIK